MNIVNILNRCSKGRTLYSLIHGEVKFVEIDDQLERYPIIVEDFRGDYKRYSVEGKLIADVGECVLFPSSTNRDWNRLLPYRIPDFKPFDKVLVRDTSNEKWELGFFSRMDGDNFITTNGAFWMQCIRYEGHEDLLGTTESVC